MKTFGAQSSGVHGKDLPQFSQPVEDDPNCTK